MEAKANLSSVPVGDAPLEPEGAAAMDVAARWALWQREPLEAFVWWLGERSISAQREAHFDAHSVAQYRSMFARVERFARERLRTVFVALRADDLRTFLAEGIAGREGRAAASTVRRYLKLLEAVFEHLILLQRELQARAPNSGHQTTATNPARELLASAEFRHPPRAAPALLGEHAQRQYIDWTLAQPESRWAQARDRALRLTFLASGITVEEARGLQVSDAVSEGGGGGAPIVALRVSGHGFVATRTAPLAAWARSGLAHWLALRHAMAVPGTSLFLARSPDPLIDEPMPTPMSATEIYVVVQEAMLAIGHTGPRQGPQTLRNTFIARQLQEQVPPERIAQWCGLATLDSIHAIARLLPNRGGVQAA